MGAAAIPIAIAASGAGAGALSGFFAPEGQEIQSFADRYIDIPDQPGFSIDPGTHLALALQDLQQIGAVMQGRANAPVTLGNTLPSAFVQQPATFSGGGLPMDIGMTGFDAANPFFSPSSQPGGFSNEAQSLMHSLGQDVVKNLPNFSNVDLFAPLASTPKTGPQPTTGGRNVWDGKQGPQRFTEQPPSLGPPPDLDLGGPPDLGPPPLMAGKEPGPSSPFPALPAATMQDALEMLGFPMSSITRRRT